MDTLAQGKGQIFIEHKIGLVAISIERNTTIGNAKEYRAMDLHQKDACHGHPFLIQR